MMYDVLEVRCVCLVVLMRDLEITTVIIVKMLVLFAHECSF